jgi:peptidyl-tRNA hydrolase ICT1
LTDDVKNILKMMHVNQITKEGYLIVKSDRTRSRQLNQADALQKLRQFIWASVDEVRTYLERSQVTQVEQEKLLKAEQRAARERVKSKRIYSQQKQARKPSDF